MRVLNAFGGASATPLEREKKVRGVCDAILVPLVSLPNFRQKTAVIELSKFFAFLFVFVKACLYISMSDFTGQYLLMIL
jgi:hypothetical protein